MSQTSKSSTGRSIAMLTLATIIAASIFVIAPNRVRATGSEDPALLTAFGYAIGQSLLVTHLAVGTLADASTKNVYQADEANNFINTYINLSNGMREQLSKLLATGTLAKDDATMIQHSIEVADLVLKESRDLKAYMASATKADAEAYNSSRKQAIKELRILLNMKN